MIRTGMHLCSRKMVQCNGFPNRLLELVRRGCSFRIYQQVLWHTMREVAVSEYYSEGPKAAIWLMDFEYPQLTGVAKCELNTWEWQNSKVVSATFEFLMRARFWCKAPSILHPILWCLSFIRWSAGFKCPRSRTFTPHWGRLFPYMKHFRKLSCQRRWHSFWRPGHRWWRASINISI